MSEEITKEMLYSYFANELTTIQKRRIDEWAKKEENRELFYECLSQWETQNLQYHSDIESALRRHQRRQEEIVHSAPEISLSKGSSRKATYRIVAAAVVLMVLALAGYLSKEELLYQTLSTTNGQTKSISLSDGTRVILNSNSSLTVPRFGFGDKTREVSLKGEANFSVTHLPNKQKFIVKTADGADIVVLGTEFTVYSRSHKFKVALAKGKIQLNYKENTKKKELIMKPGELVTINSKEGKAVLEKTEHPEKFTEAKDNRYVFEHTSLIDVCAVLKKDFNIDIEIEDPEISTWAVSGSFKASNAQDLLEALAETSGMVYEEKNNRIIIHSINQ